ncbi:MAG: NUDIX domain-containing protein [Ignavibacteriae bacterium]|nr:NUDIX domain-containing protein [Ignavibacteriota bacterium]
MRIVTGLIEAHIVRMKNEQLEFLLLKRAPNEKYPHIWQMVTGKIKPNEKAYETVIREIKEETNLEIHELFVVPKTNSFYNEVDDTIMQIPVFAATVINEEVIVLSKEHTEYKWVEYKKVKKLLAWPGQKGSTKIISDFFERKYKSLNFIKIEIVK